MAMPHLHELYASSFFQEWGRDNLPYVASARTITKVLYDNFHPQRLIDIGCGCGVYSHLFAQKGVQVVALDGVRPPPDCGFGVDIQIRDLTEPVENEWGDFDLALCLDVGEHIPVEQSNTFLENITRFADTLLLSCAPPNQGGTHHVNEQPKRYWVKRLAEHGFDYHRGQTGVLCETFKQVRTELMWMWEQISVYHRRL